MRVLVFEQWNGGHYFNYIECLVPRLAQIASEVVVAITEAASRTPLFAEQLAPLQALPNVRFDTSVPLPQWSSAAAYRLTLGRHVIDAVRRHRPDALFLPSADEQSLPFPLLARQAGRRSLHVEAVIHYRTYLARDTRREVVISAVERALLRTQAFAQINFVNFLQYEEAVARRLPIARIARVAGDPVPQPERLDRQAARTALGLGSGGRLLAMIGALDRRKAVLQTVEAFRRAALAPDDRLLLAGRLDPGYAAALQRDHADLIGAGRLVVFDRFLSELELRQCYAAADVNCSVYVDFLGLSSLMLKSVAADVPVVVGQRGWGAAIVKRFGLGHCADPYDADAFAATLTEALAARASYRRTEAIKRLLRFHTIDNFAGGMTERCAKLAGSVIVQPALDWAWVMEGVEPARRALR